jgi:hypothetical protein
MNGLFKGSPTLAALLPPAFRRRSAGSELGKGGAAGEPSEPSEPRNLAAGLELLGGEGEREAAAGGAGAGAGADAAPAAAPGKNSKSKKKKHQQRKKRLAAAAELAAAAGGAVQRFAVQMGVGPDPTKGSPLKGSGSGSAPAAGAAESVSGGSTSADSSTTSSPSGGSSPARGDADGEPERVVSGGSAPAAGKRVSFAEPLPKDEFEVVDLGSPSRGGGPGAARELPAAAAAAPAALAVDEGAAAAAAATAAAATAAAAGGAEEPVCHEFLVSVAALGSSETTIFQDWLDVRAPEGAWRRRWVLVHNNVLYVFPSFDSSRPTSIVILDQVSVESAEPEEGAFALRLRSRTGRLLLLRAASDKMRDQWVELLTTHNFEYQMSLRRKLAAQVESHLCELAGGGAASPRRRARGRGRQQHQLKLQQQRALSAPTYEASAGVMWSIFVLVQVMVQLSLDVAVFLSRRPLRINAPPRTRAPVL